MLLDEMKEELVQGLTAIFQNNISMIIRYEKIFSIVDIREDNMKKWERVLPFYQNIRKEGIVLWKAA